jgi:hypothetical protein
MTEKTYEALKNEMDRFEELFYGLAITPESCKRIAELKQQTDNT